MIFIGLIYNNYACSNVIQSILTLCTCAAGFNSFTGSVCIYPAEATCTTGCDAIWRGIARSLILLAMHRPLISPPIMLDSISVYAQPRVLYMITSGHAVYNETILWECNSRFMYTFFVYISKSTHDQLL